MGGVCRNSIEGSRQFPTRNGHLYRDLAQLSAGDRRRRRAEKNRQNSRAVEPGCLKGGRLPVEGPRLAGHSIDEEPARRHFSLHKGLAVPRITAGWEVLMKRTSFATPSPEITKNRSRLHVP